MFRSKSALNWPLSKIFLWYNIVINHGYHMMSRPNYEKCVTSAIPKSTIKSIMCRSGTAYIINSSPSRTCLRIALVRVCLMIQFLLPLFINFIEWNGQLIAWWELWLRFLDWEFPSAMFYIINIFLQTGCQSSLYRPLHNKTLWKKNNQPPT